MRTLSHNLKNSFPCSIWSKEHLLIPLSPKLNCCQPHLFLQNPMLVNVFYVDPKNRLCKLSVQWGGYFIAKMFSSIASFITLDVICEVWPWKSNSSGHNFACTANCFINVVNSCESIYSVNYCSMYLQGPCSNTNLTWSIPLENDMDP